MTACCIGYYSDLTFNSARIQGQYVPVDSDPLYVQDFAQWLIPIGDNTIYKENKPYKPSTDVIAGGGRVYAGRGIQIAGGGIQTAGGSKSTTYYGSGLQIAGGGSGSDRRGAWKIEEQDMQDKSRLDTHTNIKHGEKDRYMYQKRYNKRKKKGIRRPIASDMFKITNKKIELPAQRLRKRMIDKYGDQPFQKKGKKKGKKGGRAKNRLMSKDRVYKNRTMQKNKRRPKPDTYEKRDQIKDLLHRLK